MRQLFKAVNGQSVLDVCLNTYGGLDNLAKLIQDSGHSNVNTAPASGQAFTFDDDLITRQTITGGPGKVTKGFLLATNPVDSTIETETDYLIDSDGVAMEDFDDANILYR